MEGLVQVGRACFDDTSSGETNLTLSASFSVLQSEEKLMREVSHGYFGASLRDCVDKAKELSVCSEVSGP